MNKIILLFLISLFPITLSANKLYISGKVFDENNMPLIGAQISCKNENKRAVSNFDGEFILTGLSCEIAAINVSYLGYETYFTHVKTDTENSPELTIKMTPDDKLLAEVEVFGCDGKSQKNSIC